MTLKNSRFAWLSIIVLLQTLAGTIHAAGYPAYAPTLPIGEVCEVKLRALHPTQFCVGEEEVAQRAEKLGKMKPKKLDTYLDAHIVPIVIGPQGVPYIIDHHHLADAMITAEVQDTVPAKIMENWATLDPATFWDRMRQHGWVYLYRRGQGPLSPKDLPSHVWEMTDDPYRSLVWAARQADPSIVRDEAPFADFKWADIFRSRISLGNSAAGFAQAAQQAAKMMQHQ